jgi:GNAT superfamily N-acetyltransferase
MKRSHFRLHRSKSKQQRFVARLIYSISSHLRYFFHRAELYLCPMSTVHAYIIKKATTTTDFENGKRLFIQYLNSLSFEITFQDVDRELAEIHIEYNLPTGVLLLAYDGDKAIACAGVRKIDGQIGELKRMFVDPAYRGHQLGQRILQLSIHESRSLGYRYLRLDTVPEMQAAIKLYHAAGFYPIEAYRFNPRPGALFMEKEL